MGKDIVGDNRHPFGPPYYDGLLPMRYALVSDIHANWQAWSAVRDDIRVQEIGCILCLGDVIGYGPQPARVLDDIRQHCDNFVLGNHDAVVAGLLDRRLFNDNARFVIDWTCDQLDGEAATFFAGVPMVRGDDKLLCVHAEAANPEHWSYIRKPEDARASFEQSGAELIFVGHTHQPLICRYGQGTLEGGIPVEENLLNPAFQYLVNVGSVGDPRDGGAAATYCIFDDETRKVSFRRLRFDYDAFREDLRRSRLPVRPSFLDCLESTSETTTRKIAVSEMAIDPSSAAIEPEAGGTTAQKRSAITRRNPITLTAPIGRPAAVAAPPVDEDRKRHRLMLLIGGVVLLLLLLGGLTSHFTNRVRQVPAVVADEDPEPVSAGNTFPSARFVRVCLPGKTEPLTLVEVEIYENGTNIAPSGTASQSSTDFEGVAALAIDGRVATKFFDHTSTHTSVRSPAMSPWWEVDLGREVAVQAIRIWNRSDGEPNNDLAGRLNGFAVELYNANRFKVWEARDQKAPVASSPSCSIFPGGEPVTLPTVVDESAAAKPATPAPAVPKPAAPTPAKKPAPAKRK